MCGNSCPFVNDRCSRFELSRQSSQDDDFAIACDCIATALRNVSKHLTGIRSNRVLISLTTGQNADSRKLEKYHP